MIKEALLIDNEAPLEQTRYLMQDPLTIHDFHRASYVTMLQLFPREWILEFWEAHPIVYPDKILIGAELLHFLWHCEGKIPLRWNYYVVNDLEPFLISKGVSPNKFIEKLLYRNNAATYFPGKEILAWFYPLMQKAFNATDTHDMVFDLISVCTEKYLPGHIHRRVKKVEGKKSVQSYLVYIPDKTFTHAFNFNFDFVVGPQILKAPKILGLAPFAQLQYLSDIRSINNILPDHSVRVKGQQLWINGECYGHKIAFTDFLKSHELSLAKYKIPAAQVILMEKDFFCPLRQRILLHAQCVYSAPIYMTCVKHQKVQLKNGLFLKHLVEDAAQHEKIFAGALMRKHQNLISQLEANIVFIYRPQEVQLILNGKIFLKTVSAKILRNILIELIHKGKKEFEYRSFKKDQNLLAGQKKPNFEIRLYRLKAKLETQKIGLHIVINGQGSFSVHADAKIDFHEES